VVIIIGACGLSLFKFSLTSLSASSPIKSVLFLRYSDTIILNKTDLIGEEALNEVKENLNKLNPQAPIIITTYKFSLTSLSASSPIKSVLFSIIVSL
jgi:hypothetical protein